LQSLIDLSTVKGSVDEVAARADVKGLEGWNKLAGLMDSLASRNVQDARINLGIVRGLDYYSGTVFEAFDPAHEGGALVGGGRYDRLTEAFGRKDIGATGVAGGVERIVMALQRHGILKPAPQPLVYVAFASDDARAKALELASSLRNAGIAADYDILGRALRKQLDDASMKGAVAAVIVAPAELAAGQVTVRSMKDGSETKQPIDKISQALAGMLRA
jgi:histidyl-tRNA synthetase